MTWIGELIKAAQGPARFLYAVAAVGVFFLLIPVPWADWLGAEEVLATWRGWIALVTVSAFAFATAAFAPTVAKLWRRKASTKARIKSLEALSGEERILLGYCAHRDRRTVLLSLDSTASKVAEGLCQKGLMEQAVGGHSVLAWPFTIPAAIWPSIKKRIDAILGENWRNDANLLKQFLRLDKQASGREGAL